MGHRRTERRSRETWFEAHYSDPQDAEARPLQAVSPRPGRDVAGAAGNRHVIRSNADASLIRLNQSEIHEFNFHSLTSFGSVNWKVAPRSELAAAHRRPPWDSIMDRLIDSPMPVPWDLVVKNASKILFAP